MKRALWIAAYVFLLVTVCFSAVWAMDFSAMSNAELFQLRKAIVLAPPPDQQAYKLEWDKRLAVMPVEEKERYEQLMEKEEKEKNNQPHIIGRGYEQPSQRGQVIMGGGRK